MNYHCITAEECRNLNVIDTSGSLFIPFKGKCQEGCPEGFQVKFAIDGNKMSASCTPCVGKECWQICKSELIDDIPAAQKLKGCQVVDGNLDIQINAISDRNFEEELEKSLSDIVEIEGYLKIARSPQISSLKFLRNLKIIHGNQLEGNKYSLIIWDNSNLEELFGNQNIDIAKGKTLISFNPRLCFKAIDSLSVNQTKIDKSEETKISNGYESMCNVSGIEVQVTEISSNTASLRWGPLDQKNTSLNYVLFYRSFENDK